jgi:hypothetical protein
MVCNTQDYWVFGLWTKEHNISETGSASVLGLGVGEHLLCWVC